MPDRAAPFISITIAPLYKRRISSAYALNDFVSTIMLGVSEKLHLTEGRQIQFTAIGLPDAEASNYNYGTQESALGGRGIIAAVLLMLVTTTAPTIRMDFDSVVLNMMAFLLSAYDTDRHYDGMAVIELVGLNFLITRLGELALRSL